MEEHLINYYQMTRKDLIDNKEPESTGPDGNLLYVCFKVGRLLSRKESYNSDTIGSTDDLPINL